MKLLVAALSITTLVGCYDMATGADAVLDCAPWTEGALPALGDGFGPASSSLAVTADGVAVIAAEDYDRVWLVDLAEVRSGDAPHISGGVVVADAPSHVLVDGARAYVTTRGGGTLEVIDLDGPSLLRSIPVGVEPRGLTRLPGEGGIAVALAGEAAVAFVDVEQGVVTRREPLATPEPWAVGVVAESLLVVGHRSGPLSSIDLVTGRHGTSVPLVTTYAGLSLPVAYAPTPVGFSSFTVVGDRLLAPHGLADPTGARSSGSGGCAGYYGGCTSTPGAIEPALAWLGIDFVDFGSQRAVVQIDGAFRQRGPGASETTAAAIVRAGEDRGVIVALERGRSVAAVTCPSTNEMSRSSEVPIGAGADGIAPTPDGRAAAVWSRFDRTLSLVEIEDGTARVTTTAPIVPEVLPLAVADGRRLFHDATALSAAGVISCAGCHPDGRDDGLSWQMPNGRRNTPSLAGGILDTAPFHWSGDIDDVHGLNAMTVRTLMGGIGLDDAQLEDLSAYLDAIAAPPVPEQERSLVEAGRALFESEALGCTSCHSGADRTDNQNHVLASTSPSPMQTPPLHGVARTAPYLHQGSAATLEEVVDLHVRGEGMGGGLLSDENADALVAYLKTL